MLDISLHLQNNDMTIGYAIMLNNECHNFIRQVQLEIHQQTSIGLPRQTPHITIKSPFETIGINNHVSYLEKLASNVKPIDIEFDGFDSFGDKVVYLKVKENPQLYDLHYKVLQEVKEEFGISPHELEGKQVKFHVSIAAFNNTDDFQNAQNLLSKYQPKFMFEADELGLFYYLGENKGWIVNHRIRIKNG